MTREFRRLLSLVGLEQGHGRADAVRVWFALWSFARWSGRSHDVWPGNAKIAELAGMSVRRVQRGLALLERSGKISTRWGRPRHGRAVRRMITLAPGVERRHNPRVETWSEYFGSCVERDIRKHRERPGTCIGLAMAIYACARLTGGDEAHITMAALREITGSPHGQAFYRRLEVLERAGVIERLGERWCDGLRVRDYDAEMGRRVARRPRLPAPARLMLVDLVPEQWEPVADLPAQASGFW